LEATRNYQDHMLLIVINYLLTALKSGLYRVYHQDMLTAFFFNETAVIETE